MRLTNVKFPKVDSRSEEEMNEWEMDGWMDAILKGNIQWSTVEIFENKIRRKEVAWIIY